MTLKDLSDALHAETKKQYPNMPDHALTRKKLTDKTANGLQQCILEFFKLKNIKAWRQQSGGRFLKEVKGKNVVGQTITMQKGRYIPQGKSGGKGAGDIVATIPPFGRALHVEVKIGADRQSEDQKTFQREHEASGGLYFITKTWDDFYFQISQILNKHPQQLNLL